ncbi:DNA repair protein [Vigna angularis]|uniref:DNA repair protein n=1 Tax=Phaseolus angularis TaxID=3914 RepID=A0A8T0JKX5_PHAAN|nr:DNA repair protein [Vigna angularis]
MQFHNNFHVKNCTSRETSPCFGLASALELHEGSPEEKSKKCRVTKHMDQSRDLPIFEVRNDSVANLKASETQDSNLESCLTDKSQVYCSEENLTGKWVHVDAVNLIIDGEDKVEAMVAACKTSLRYVVAFAGQGVKDVTHRRTIDDKFCRNKHRRISYSN